MRDAAIPVEAEERVTERYRNGGKRAAEYVLNGEVVGQRSFHENGAVAYEQSLRNGRRHGAEREWSESGALLWRTQYVDGREHGTAQQWDEAGRLVGSYSMEHGTGLDLWWSNCGTEPWQLSEARWCQDGRRHGFEWWLSDPTSVSQEGHYWEGREHGILREWNAEGRLRRGFPQYYVHGQKVTRRQYLRAAAKDPSLPPFRLGENAPGRTFPPEVQAALRRNSASTRD
jgi:antitoxin component YwqK of YwqJK toxin-antitoxin module